MATLLPKKMILYLGCFVLLLATIINMVEAASTPPGIAKNPARASCKLKKYKMCYNLEHVCPKFCPDSCEVECASCKPICSGASSTPPPVEDDEGDDKGDKKGGDDGKDKDDGDKGGKKEGDDGKDKDGSDKGDEKEGDEGKDNDDSDKGGKKEGNDGKDKDDSDKGGKKEGDDGKDKDGDDDKEGNNNKNKDKENEDDKGDNGDDDNDKDKDKGKNDKGDKDGKKDGGDDDKDKDKEGDKGGKKDNDDYNKDEEDNDKDGDDDSKSSPPYYPPSPTTPSPPTPTPPSPSPPTTPTPSPQPPTPSPSTPTTPSPPTTPIPSPKPPTPSPPTPTLPPSPTTPTPSPKSPTPVSPPNSGVSAGKRVRCKNKNYGQCYNQQHLCPASCPTSCQVDCVTCKPVCSCDYPGAVCQDPRFIGGDGITFYFHGKKNQDFCLVTDRNLHINAHFIGKRNQNSRRDFTWVESIGILFNNHRLFVGAKKTSTWDDANDRLSLAFDGVPINLEQTLDFEWRSSSTPQISITRTNTQTNNIVVQVQGILKITAQVVPITEQESRVHNYGITKEDCLAHLDLGFKFLSLTGKVDGVLGKTYREEYVSKVNVRAAMSVMGGEKEYESSSIFATDCLASAFNNGNDNDDHHGGEELSIMELADINCATGMNGEPGVVCKR